MLGTNGRTVLGLCAWSVQPQDGRSCSSSCSNGFRPTCGRHGLSLLSPLLFVLQWAGASLRSGNDGKHESWKRSCSSSKARKEKQMTKAIEARALGHSYSEKPVLKDVSFDVHEGEIWGLLGPSGAGKTTLVRILMGQLHPQEGSAAVLGTNTTKLTGREHSKISAMMDNYGLYARLSVLDNLTCDSTRTFCAHRGAEWIRSWRSSGSRMRIGRPYRSCPKECATSCALRALINDPRVAFLDEPTAGLDPLTTRQIHVVLRAQRDRGATIFLTTHNMQEAAELCDNVALLHEARMLACRTCSFYMQCL